MREFKNRHRYIYRRKSKLTDDDPYATEIGLYEGFVYIDRDKLYEVFTTSDGVSHRIEYVLEKFFIPRFDYLARPHCGSNAYTVKDSCERILDDYVDIGEEVVHVGEEEL